MAVVIWSCDNDSDNGAPKGEATIAITGEFNDSLTFTPTFRRLPDSSRVIPGPDSFKTNVQIKGSNPAADSFRLELYIMDEQAEIQERAYLVKRLTLQNSPNRAAAVILRTPNGSLFETQTSSKGQGTVIVETVKQKRIKGALKAVKLSDGTENVFLNGKFEAVKP